MKRPNVHSVVRYVFLIALALSIINLLNITSDIIDRIWELDRKIRYLNIVLEAHTAAQRALGAGQ